MQPITYTTIAFYHSAVNQPTTQRFALLGALTVAIATVVAIALVPTDPVPKGALFESALVMTAGLIIAPFLAVCRYPQSLLRAESLIAISPIYWLLLDLLQGAYPLDGVSPENVNTAFLSIGVFVMAMWAGTYLRPWRFAQSILKSASMHISGVTIFRLSVAAFALGMLKSAIPANFNVLEMFSYLGSGRWAAPWGRGQLGGWDAFQDQLQYFGYLLPALTVIVARHDGWTNTKTLCSGAMSIVMTLFLMQGGGRRIIGMIFGMALILWVITQRRFHLKSVILTLGSTILLLVSLQLMVEYRNAGLGTLTDRDENAPVFQREYLHVDDNFLRLSQVISLIPGYYPYVSYKYITWVLVRPIPRVFWPGKPLDPGFDLPSAVGVTGASLSCSVVGELYMSAGFVGIIIGGLLYGRLARTASQLLSGQLQSSALIIYAILAMSLFVGVRSMLDLVLMNYALLAWAGLSLAYMHLKRRQAT